MDEGCMIMHDGCMMDAGWMHGGCMMDDHPGNPGTATSPNEKNNTRESLSLLETALWSWGAAGRGAVTEFL